MEIVNIHKEYNNYNNILYSCQYHVVFCPKYRRKVLINSIETRLKELIMQKQEEYKYKIIEMEIMPDHVHLLIDSNPKIGIYNQIIKIKGFTSHILREEFYELKTRIPTLWTRSCFISTVGSVSLETVKKYIENQKNK